MEFKEYITAIEKNLKNLTQFNIYLSEEDINIIRNWYKKDIPLERINKTIYNCLSNIPKKKRKFLSLKKIDKEICKLKTIKIFKEDKSFKGNTRQEYSINPEIQLLIEQLENLGIKVNINDYTDETELKEHLEKKIISFIWKNISDEEREIIRREALKELKAKYNLSHTDKKEALKFIIANKIKKIYNLP